MNFQGIEKLSDSQLHQLYGTTLYRMENRTTGSYNCPLCIIAHRTVGRNISDYCRKLCPAGRAFGWTCISYIIELKDLRIGFLDDLIDELEYERDVRGLPKDFFAERLEKP